MFRKSAVITAIVAATILNWSAWGQTGISNGASVTSLNVSGTRWNQHPISIYNSSSGVYLYYWNCGNSSQDGICVGQRTPGGTVSNVTQAIFTNSSVCDIQDPGVVLFNGTYYLYAGGITGTSISTCNNKNAAGNQHAAIYAWQSSDGHSFTALNNGNPVVQTADDANNCATHCYTGHGINGPTPVVMAECSCIRLYYWYDAAGNGVISGGTGIESQDSTDGVTFGNERAILPYGYWPQIRKSGLYGDYPLVMTFLNNSGVGNGTGFVTAVSSGFSDLYWTCQYSCNGFTATSLTQPANYAPSLESDLTGTLLDTSQNALSLSGLNSGQQLYLDWDNNVVANSGSYIYRGSTTGSNLFPDLTSDPAPWPVSFIPSSYPQNQGITETFYAQAADYAGGSAILYLQPFFSNSSDLSNLNNSCHILYASSNNTLYLDRSAGDFNWVSSQQSGGSWSNSNSNTVCQINSWSTSTSGNYLTLTVNVTFLQQLTWYEFASATNATGSSPWLTNNLTWSY